MSGIGLQQSILMGKNNNLSASLREHKNAIDGWEHYCKKLEFKLEREKSLHACEMRKTGHLTKAVGNTESALKHTESALDKTESAALSYKSAGETLKKALDISENESEG
ncbi:MAG: hypothetical protein Q9N67_05550 [Ghiorsea sp.]|nr:hypothetical protein [Ghiorsea sp.]